MDINFLTDYMIPVIMGICRKLTYTEDRPVLTRPDGFCHRAEKSKL